MDLPLPPESPPSDKGNVSYFVYIFLKPCFNQWRFWSYHKWILKGTFFWDTLYIRPETMWTRCLGGFFVMWVPKLLISPVKKRIFCPKTTKFGPKLAFLVNLGQAMQAYSVPCWWVGWWLWRAGCISQDTYLLYLKILLNTSQTLTEIKGTLNKMQVVDMEMVLLSKWLMVSCSILQTNSKF